jgi:hypothetical protein
MADPNQVTLSSGETGADAPESPTINETSLGTHGISVTTDPEEVAETPIGEAPTESARPEWLPEKFEHAEDLAKAYASLEARMGSAASEEAEEASKPTESKGVEADALQPFYEEYANSGALTEESFTALEKMGLGRDLVSSFMKGQKATHDAELSTIYSEVGGAEAYQSAVGWAAQAMTPKEIQAFNDQVETGDYETAKMAVRGLMAMYAQSGATGVNQPHLLKSEPSNIGGAVYESLAQVMDDMKAPQYKSDPAFRAKVQQKISRSNVM